MRNKILAGFLMLIPFIALWVGCYFMSKLDVNDWQYFPAVLTISIVGGGSFVFIVCLNAYVWDKDGSR